MPSARAIERPPCINSRCGAEPFRVRLEVREFISSSSGQHECHIALYFFLGIIYRLQTSQPLDLTRAFCELFSQLIQSLRLRERRNQLRFYPEHRFPMAWQRCNLTGVRNSRLVPKPLPRGKKDEYSNKCAHHVILPDPALIVP